MNNSATGCGHVFIGQAEHTIVKMPSSCGKGPYARIVSLDVHSDQNALPAMYNSLKPASESVHLLSFDYNFLAIVRRLLFLDYYSLIHYYPSTA